MTFQSLDQIFCEASNVGLREGIDSKWCNDNCKNGRHPACKSIGDEKQLCICMNKGNFSLTMIFDYTC